MRNKHDTIISTHLYPEPAVLLSAELRVDVKRWRVSSNQGLARQQTGVKNFKVRKQIKRKCSYSELLNLHRLNTTARCNQHLSRVIYLKRAVIYINY